MSATAQLCKLTELRAKTDRDLVWLIDNGLEMLLPLADTHGDSGTPLPARAQEIYANNLMLIPKVEDVGERRRLEEMLKQLRERLEGRMTQVACV
jgi:hypothetical protein